MPLTPRLILHEGGTGSIELPESEEVDEDEVWPELADSTHPLVAKHFQLTLAVTDLYMRRDESAEGRNKAIAACCELIALADDVAPLLLDGTFGSQLPSHKGYEQLAIILEKDKDYSGAIELCEQAQRQGWRGTWQRRINRCRARAAKQRQELGVDDIEL